MISKHPILQFARFNERFEPRAANRLHNHPNWQVELITAGTPILRTQHGETYLQAGNIVLLPPYTPHDFSYNRGRSAWYTIRFSAEATDASLPLIASEGSNQDFFRLLTGLLESFGRDVEGARKDAIEYILAAILAYNASEPRAPVEMSSFLQKIHDFLSLNCDRAITVDEVADCVGYSSSHTRALYKQKTGQSLKKAIDLARLNEASQFLLHSDYSISEIAQELGFPDVYTFSRFVKRLAGKSPRSIRQAQQV